MISGILAELLTLQQFFVFIPLLSIIFWAHACTIFFFASAMYAVSQRSLRLSTSHSLALTQRELEFDNLVIAKAKDLSAFKQKDLEREIAQKFDLWKSEAEKDLSQREKTLQIEGAIIKEAKELKAKYTSLMGSQWVLLADETSYHNISLSVVFSILSSRVKMAACGESLQYAASIEIISRYGVSGYYKLFCADDKGSTILVEQINKLQKAQTDQRCYPITIKTKIWARSKPE